MATHPHSVEDVLDRLEDLAEENQGVRVGDMVEAFGSRSYGPCLIVPPLLEISPIGGVPGVATATAGVVILFSGQMLLGRKHLWLPGFVTRWSFTSRRLCIATRKMRPIGAWMDRWFHGRLRALTTGVYVRAAAAACIVLSMTVPLLEFIPFASTAPMAAVALFGLALLVHDGALMLAAAAATCAALVVAWSVLA